MYIFLSPHFDDVALSCGGHVWQLSQANQHVEIWTIFAAEPQIITSSTIVNELHARWDAGPNPVRVRKKEDIRSCEILSANYKHFDFLDAIYRTDYDTGLPLYPTWQDVIGPMHPSDARTLNRLRKVITRSLSPGAALFVPLSIGNHIDHVLTRAASLGSKQIRYYQDYPYVAGDIDFAHQIPAGYSKRVYPISQNALKAWQDSIAAYSSQINSFWQDEAEMRDELADYCQRNQGVAIWEKA